MALHAANVVRSSALVSTTRPPPESTTLFNSGVTWDSLFCFSSGGCAKETIQRNQLIAATAAVGVVGLI